MKTKHPRIIAHIPRTFGDLIVFAQTVVKKMTNNPLFKNPTPPLAQVTTSIQALQDAQLDVKTSKGAGPALDKKAQDLVNNIHGLEAYVQGLAAANPDKTDELAAAAGFAVGEHGVHEHAPLSAKMGPGLIVILRALAGDHGSVYEWQWSEDGKTWTAVPSTNHAHTTIAGLTEGKTYQFHVRINKGEVVGDWSQPVSLLVH